MRATSKDLRFHTKEILDAAMRGEEVTITYHGKPCARIVPIEQDTARDKENPFFGMWADRGDLEDVTAHVRRLRKRRSL